MDGPEPLSVLAFMVVLAILAAGGFFSFLFFAINHL